MYISVSRLCSNPWELGGHWAHDVSQVVTVYDTTASCTITVVLYLCFDDYNYHQ